MTTAKVKTTVSQWCQVKTAGIVLVDRGDLSLRIAEIIKDVFRR